MAGEQALRDASSRPEGTARCAAASGAAAPFRPVFVVGCQRSGTTALAVMLDRHSRIAMLPETQFFWSYEKRDRAGGAPMTHEHIVERALSDKFIRETHLTTDELLATYRRYEPTHENFFRALMEAYAARHGKARPAEKSCNHLFAADRLLALYPEAKIICILRDGRDVVRSIRNVPWGRSLPWGALCRKWKWFAGELRRAQARNSADRLTVVRYEVLMAQPEAELRRLCEFIGESFEPTQLERGTGTDVVPTYELGWKGKAKDRPDANRAAAWRRNESPEQIALWNHYMGRALRDCGYDDTEVRGVSPLKRLWWSIQYIPFLPGVFPIAVAANRMIRRLRGGGAVEEAPEPAD